MIWRQESESGGAGKVVLGIVLLVFAVYLLIALTQGVGGKMRAPEQPPPTSGSFKLFVTSFS